MKNDKIMESTYGKNGEKKLDMCEEKQDKF